MKRVIHMIFCGVYCILALAGCLWDFGLLPGSVAGAPFVFYTSLSNMAGGLFMLAALIRNIRKGEVGVWPRMKFVLMLTLLVTLIVYHWVLSAYTAGIPYFITLVNGLYHLVLPVMFAADWLLFYRRGGVNVWDPVVEAGLSALYGGYILVRGAIVRYYRISNTVVYPYFFLNPEHLGWKNQILWMVGMTLGHLILGYGLFVLDRLLRKRKKKPGA